MPFIILLVFALFVAESLAQSTTTKLFLNKDYQVTTTTSDVFYRVNQTIISESPKTWIDSIFNNNSADSTTLVRVNKYEVSGNDTLLNGIKKSLLNSQNNSQGMGQEKEIGTIECGLFRTKFPVFKKNDTDLNDFLIENIVYPEDARKKGLECEVILTFVVEKDMSISDIQASNCDNASMVKEAIRVIGLTSGYWIPGELNGNKVRVSAMILITFSLD